MRLSYAPLQDVARDPNSPFQQLKMAIPYYPREVLTNPAFPLALVSNLNLITSLENFELEALVRYPEAPEPLIEHAISKVTARPSLALALLANPSLNKEQVERANHTYENEANDTRFNHKHLSSVWDKRNPVDILLEARKAIGNNTRGHYKHFEYTGLTNYIFSRAEDKWDEETRWQHTWMAQAPYTPPEILNQLTTFSYLRQRTLHLIAENTSTPGETLVNLYKEHPDDIELLAIIVKHPNAPESLHLQALEDNHPTVIAHVAQNPHLDPTIQQALFNREDPAVNHFLAGNPNLDIEIQDQLVETNDESVHRHLLRTATLTRKNLQTLRNSKSSTIRESVRNYQPSTPIKTQTREQALTNLAQEIVRQQRPLILELITSTCTNTPGELLTFLAGSPNALTRLAVAIHPNTPANTRKLLNVDPDQRVSNASRKEPCQLK